MESIEKSNNIQLFSPGQPVPVEINGKWGLTTRTSLQKYS